jgi:hypothetical protein
MPSLVQQQQLLIAGLVLFPATQSQLVSSLDNRQTVLPYTCAVLQYRLYRKPLRHSQHPSALPLTAMVVLLPAASKMAICSVAAAEMPSPQGVQEAA